MERDGSSPVKATMSVCQRFRGIIHPFTLLQGPVVCHNTVRPCYNGPLYKETLSYRLRSPLNLNLLFLLYFIGPCSM